MDVDKAQFVPFYRTTLPNPGEQQETLALCRYEIKADANGAAMASIKELQASLLIAAKSNYTKRILHDFVDQNAKPAIPEWKGSLL